MENKIIGKSGQRKRPEKFASIIPALVPWAQGRRQRIFSWIYPKGKWPNVTWNSKEQFCFFFLAGKCSKKSFSTDLLFRYWSTNFLCSSVGKESACNAGDPGSNPGSGRSPGEGNGNPLQYSCLENPTDRGAWQAIVHGIARVRHDLVTNHHHCSDEDNRWLDWGHKTWGW